MRIRQVQKIRDSHRSDAEIMSLHCYQRYDSCNMERVGGLVWKVRAW
jgi:hypothetical protein